ncbi:MAG: UDP-N-acetylmuramoyl-L-alanyl-D-glutamate--2,6-diaminopimelate ligase [Gemmatimonadota bacterium]|nr:UDP-N-acetylmuramoyl-L-alanyl-D-glutamate--2,6-diaminopimelate ligase [Gemmatimonadota bacterium]
MEQPAPSITLADLARLCGGRVEGDPDVRPTGVTHDSRRVGSGSLFAAISGFERDGHDYVGDAVAAGAVAALVSRAGEWDVPTIVVDDVRRALGPVSHAIHGNPTRELVVAGVTGTNGKTTTSFMAGAVLEARHAEVAVLGTLGLRRGERVEETGFTTPEAPDLARLFRDLADDGVEAVSMEVSSHAIELGRSRGIEFAAGAFTNLSAEHLDFHGTLEAYGESKLGFFRQLADLDAVAAVNADDAWGERFREAGPETTWRYSLEDPAAEVYAERLEVEPDGTTLEVATPAGRFATRLAMAGRFNAANAMAAATMGVALGIEPAAVGEALGTIDRVPGRYEVYRGGGVTAVVDYAHTPLAFERILETVRDSGARRVFVVFGCGGERDRSKRPEMARIAGTRADVAYVTVDNPRKEPIERIMDDTLAGFEGTEARWARIDDRSAAVRRAIGEAEVGDVVCLLGKGDEGYQEIGETKYPYSDRDAVRAALAGREGTAAPARGERAPADPASARAESSP